MSYHFEVNFRPFQVDRSWQDLDIQLLHLLVVWPSRLNHLNPSRNGRDSLFSTDSSTVHVTMWVCYGRGHFVKSCDHWWLLNDLVTWLTGRCPQNTWLRGRWSEACLHALFWSRDQRESRWLDNKVRNSRGLKVPPLSPGGFMAQHDICGPQAHKIENSPQRSSIPCKSP